MPWNRAATFYRHPLAVDDWQSVPLTHPPMPPPTSTYPAPILGDLVFYGTPDLVHHVGLYIGANSWSRTPGSGVREGR